MMTTNMVEVHNSGMTSMPFKPNIEVKVGDEKSISTHRESAQTLYRIKMTQE